MSKPKTEHNASDEALLLDDWMLDAAHEAMLRLARLCERRDGRKPTLEEFRRLLDVRLHVSAEDYFADGGTLEVTEVSFKTKKRSASQRYKDGDIFAIPLGEGNYAFGRILRCPARHGALIEIFCETSKDKAYRVSIGASGRLLHPTIENPLACLKNRRWAIVASDDAYEFPEADKDLEFMDPDPPRRRWVAVKPFAPGSASRPLSDDEFRRMEANGQRGGLGRPEDLEDRIRQALKEPKRPAK